MPRLTKAPRRKPKQLRLFEKDDPGESVQIDVKVVRLKRERVFQYTALDDCTRLRVLRLFPRQNQWASLQFLKDVQAAFPFPIRKIQCDNGAEFPLAFRLAVEHAGIRHRYIKPRRPEQNGKVEPAIALTTRNSGHAIALTACSTRRNHSATGNATTTRSGSLLPSAEGHRPRSWQHTSKLQRSTPPPSRPPGNVTCSQRASTPLHKLRGARSERRKYHSFSGPDLDYAVQITGTDGCSRSFEHRPSSSKHRLASETPDREPDAFLGGERARMRPPRWCRVALRATIEALPVATDQRSRRRGAAAHRSVCRVRVATPQSGRGARMPISSASRPSRPCQRVLL